MVTYRNISPSAMVQRLRDEQLDEVRRAWVTDYRRDHAEADWWAEGSWSIEHTVETQERVFRMAEQLAAKGIGRAALFAALRRADVLVDATGRGQLDPRTGLIDIDGRAVRREDLTSVAWPASLAAAQAGSAVIDGLIGAGTVVTLLRPEALNEHLGCEGWIPQAHAGRVLIVIQDLPSLDQMRAHGFEPLVFDGADPAAFAWAIFDLSNRINASITKRRCDCHPGFTPIPLGVAVRRLARDRNSLRGASAIQPAPFRDSTRPSSPRSVLAS